MAHWDIAAPLDKRVQINLKSEHGSYKHSVIGNSGHGKSVFGGPKWRWRDIPKAVCSDPALALNNPVAEGTINVQARASQTLFLLTRDYVILKTWVAASLPSR